LNILIAGIGNIFHGDDAFGVEVANRLLGRSLPEGVRVVDFGIRGFDLAYALLDDQEVTILVDATARGGAPGTLYTIEIDPESKVGLDRPSVNVATHGMDPLRVLQLAQSMGGCRGRLLLVGCEPETLGTPEEGQMGLSETVEAAVGGAADLVENLVWKLIRAASRASSAGAGMQPN